MSRLKLTRKQASRRTEIDRIARALFDQFRDDSMRGSGPSFYSYADGAREPCIWSEQDDDLRRYFRRRAKRLLEAISA